VNKPINILPIGKKVKFQHEKTGDYWILEHKTLEVPKEIVWDYYSLQKARNIWDTLIKLGFEEDSLEVSSPYTKEYSGYFYAPYVPVFKMPSSVNIWGQKTLSISGGNINPDLYRKIKL